MTDIVTPRVVPDMPPAPLPSDPPQIFDDKCVALAGGYAPFVAGANNSAADTNQNATAAHERAVLAQGAWASVEQGVADVQAALAAIQAGPVVSINGRSGVVTGLAETASVVFGKGTLMANAPLGQSAIFTDGTGAGADWPTTTAVSAWRVDTQGMSGAGARLMQTATQTMDIYGQQGWVFVRFKHDGAWSPWRRVFTDNTIIEKMAVNNSVSGTYTADPAIATIHHIAMIGNTTMTIPAPRSMGDQVLVRVYQAASHSLTWGGTITWPKGYTQPSLAPGEHLTVSFLTQANTTSWFAYPGGIH